MTGIFAAIILGSLWSAIFAFLVMALLDFYRDRNWAGSFMLSCLVIAMAAAAGLAITQGM